MKALGWALVLMGTVGLFDDNFLGSAVLLALGAWAITRSSSGAAGAHRARPAPAVHRSQPRDVVEPPYWPYYAGPAVAAGAVAGAAASCGNEPTHPTGDSEEPDDAAEADDDWDADPLGGYSHTGRTPATQHTDELDPAMDSDDADVFGGRGFGGGGWSGPAEGHASGGQDDFGYGGGGWGGDDGDDW